MLNILKRDLVATESVSTTDLMMEAMVNDDVRDAFLDNIDLALLGSENDSRVEKEIDSIPEYDEDELTKDEMEELENLEESVSMIPEFYE